jgi:hypothetical protein
MLFRGGEGVVKHLAEGLVEANVSVIFRTEALKTETALFSEQLISTNQSARRLNLKQRRHNPQRRKNLKPQKL